MSLHQSVMPLSRRLNPSGEPRRVGFEIEFANLNARATAHLIARVFSGTAQQHHAHKWSATTEALGETVVEIDSRYAKPETFQPDRAETSRGPSASNDPDIGTRVAAFFGTVAAGVVPTEIVTPPLPTTALHDLEHLMAALRADGAQGTRASPVYAFGLHINPEIATDDPDWLLRVIRTQVLLSDWLKYTMQIDTTRRLTGFAKPTPRRYADLIFAEDYCPDRAMLIEDYIAHNPTRDRELDMLPVFAWADEDRVRARLPVEKISARPAFHFRLPNAALGDPNWSLTREWNRWVLLERLADDDLFIQTAAVLRRRSLDAHAMTGTNLIPAMTTVITEAFMRASSGSAHPTIERET